MARLEGMKLALSLCLPALGFLVACTSSQTSQEAADRPYFGAFWRPLETGSEASLRGISVGADGSVWASGSEGTILRSLDQGENWQALGPDDPAGDYRDVEAIDAESALAIRITEPAQIVVTRDGGASWQILYESPRATSFFDSIELLDGGGFVVFGDPQEGVFEVLRSTDMIHVQAVSKSDLPEPKDGEAAFAASGTCVAAVGDRVWIGTGGQAARVLRSEDQGQTWDPVEAPLRQDTATAGIYSVAFKDRDQGVIVGGDYTQPKLGGKNAAVSVDGGKSWVPSESPPRGYRSGVAAIPGPGDLWVAVGRAGCDFSQDGGRTWFPTGPWNPRSEWEVPGYYAVAFGEGGIGYAVGSMGRVARIQAEEVSFDDGADAGPSLRARN